VTRPQADLSRESLAHRVELLEQRSHAGAPGAPEPRGENGEAAAAHTDEPEPAPGPPIELEQLRDAWPRTVLAAVRERSVPVAALLGEARPSALEDDTLTLEFPAGAEFHRKQAEDVKSIGLLRDALYEVTGRRLAIATAIAPAPDDDAASEAPLPEDDFVSLFKDTFDAEEVEETQ
jgi:hypothetical protein